MRSIYLAFLAAFLLSACEEQSSTRSIEDLQATFFTYEEDDDTGERFFRVYSFYAGTWGNEAVVHNRYYPDSARPDFYYWSARSGGSYEFKVDGDKIDLTYKYCLSGRACKSSCSGLISCEVAKTESFSGSGNFNTILSLKRAGKTAKFYNEKSYEPPVPKYGDSEADMHYDRMEVIIPDDA